LLAEAACQAADGHNRNEAALQVMKPALVKKLALAPHTIKLLDARQLAEVGGGVLKTASKVAESCVLK
jgi:hypothetical protein